MAYIQQGSVARKIEGWGADLDPANRPGVPMVPEFTHKDPGAHWDTPVRQRSRVKVFKRVGLERLTPVFGTSCPPKGLSGILRARAYRIPEHDARHWAALLFADRVDVVESRVGEFVRRPWVFGILVALVSGLLYRNPFVRRQAPRVFARIRGKGPLRSPGVRRGAEKLREHWGATRTDELGTA